MAVVSCNNACNKKGLSGVRPFWIAAAFCVYMVFLAGCNVSVRGKQRPLLTHEPIRGDLELVAENRTDDRTSGQDKYKSKTKVFEERLNLRTKGSIYHPSLLAYEAAVGLGLVQHDVSSYEVSGKTSDALESYSLFVQLLRTKQFPMSFYTTKSDNLITRQYPGSLRGQRKSSGFSLAWRTEKWPMRFQYGTSEIRQSSLASRISDFYTQNLKSFTYSVEHDFSELSNMSFKFERNKISEQNATTLTDFTENNYTLLHDLIFGSKEQHRLDSLFSVLEQSGSYNIKDTQWQERLRLQHTDNFSTNYEFRFTDSKRGTTGDKTTHGGAGFRHSLYKSLVTTGNVFTENTNIDGDGSGKIIRRGGILRFNYRKKNRWGMLISSYIAGLNITDTVGGSGTGTVTNERHSIPLSGLREVELDRVNIDITTITVKNSDVGGLSFQEGETRDYTIIQRNGRVILKINLPSVGDAPNFTVEGQEFFVDYDFFIEPKSKEDTLRRTLSIRQRFKNGLALYYSHRRQDEDVSSTVTEITPDEYIVNTYGADYAKKGLTLLAEYSKKDSTQTSDRKSVV